MMPDFTKAAAARALPLTLLVWGAVLSGNALAEDANRCSGTLCDLYYGGSAQAPAPAPAQQPALTPLTVPSTGNFFTGLFSKGPPSQGATPGTPTTGTAAPAGQQSTSLVHMGGGGLLGDRSAQQRCDGTLCDLYYGGSAPPPPEQQAAQQPATQQQGAQQQVAPGPNPSGGSVSRRNRYVETVEEEEKPRCKSGGDPWRCYRK